MTLWKLLLSSHQLCSSTACALGLNSGCQAWQQAPLPNEASCQPGFALRQSYYMAQADFKLVILLPQVPECWGYRCVHHTQIERWLFYFVKRRGLMTGFLHGKANGLG